MFLCCGCCSVVWEFKKKASHILNEILHHSFLGAPVPRAQWSKDGKHIDEGNLDTLTEPKNTQLRIPAAQRSDTGLYELTLSNEAGSDKVPVRITVMGEFSFCILLPIYN